MAGSADAIRLGRIQTDFDLYAQRVHNEANKCRTYMLECAVAL